MSYITVNSTGLPSQLQQILEAENVQPGSAISYQLCKLLWEYHPLAGKIIEKPVRLALGKSRKINIPCGIEDQLRDAFEREWDRLGATNHIRDVMHLSRVYGASAIIYGSPDVPTDQPIDPWKLAEIPDLYFNQLDPLNLAGSLVTNQNPNAPDFQKPWQYITAAGQPYHPSRSCVIFCGTPIYLSFQGSSYSFSGRSLFLRALYPLKSFIQTMTVDDLVSLKSGLLIAKIEQPGSIVNRLMSQSAGAKRALLQEAQTGNVLSITPAESIESINLQNTDKAMTTARDNIIANIAAAADVPALLLKDEAFTQGFGEGKEDSKAVAQYIEGIRNDMHSLFMYFDNIVQHRAWNTDLYQALSNAYPEEVGEMSYKEFFYWAKNLFKAEWPSLLEEPASETIRRDSEKLKAMVDVVKTLETMLDPVNKAKAVEWFMDNVNSMTNMFAAPMDLDIEALAEYEPPQPASPFGGEAGGAPGGEEPPEKPEKPDEKPMAKNDALQLIGRDDADWDESKHPRQKDGKFGKGGGGGSSAPSETTAAAPEPKKEKASAAEPKRSKETPQEAVAHEKWTEKDAETAYKEIEKDLDRGLTGKYADIQERFARQLSSDYPKAVDDYSKLEDAEGGKVLNVDTARELSPDYDKDRTMSEPVHEPGSWFIKKLYADMLAKPPGPGEEATVLFTGGGTGAGKSTAIKNLSGINEKKEKSQLVYDTNMAQAGSAIKKINQALAAGKKVNIAFVHRDPIDALVNGALPRAMNQEKKYGTGRTVPMEKHIKTHIESNQAIREIYEYYKEHGLLNNGVSIAVVDNSRGKGKAAEISLEDLPALRYADYEEKAYEELERARKEGKISETVYRGFRGVKAKADADADPSGRRPSLGEGDRGQPERRGVDDSEGEGRV